MGGPMTKRLPQDLRVLQQPTAEHQQLVSYAQPQHWPNQETPAQPEPEDDDLEEDEDNYYEEDEDLVGNDGADDDDDRNEASDFD